MKAGRENIIAEGVIFDKIKDWFNGSSEEAQLLAIQKDPESIKDIKNPSEKVQLAAVHKDHYLIRNIKRPTESVMIEVIKHDMSFIFNRYAKITNNAVIKSKPYVMKQLLEFVKYGLNDDRVLNHVKSYIGYFRKRGINWPEFNVIEKSINASVTQKNASFYESHTSNTIYSVEQALRLGMIGHAIHDIHSFKLTLDDTQGLEELLNQYKDVIIKYILTKFKEDLEYGTYLLTSGLINDLKSTNITWSEITTIEKSIQSEINRILNRNSSINESTNDYNFDRVVHYMISGNIDEALAIIEQRSITIVAHESELNELLNTYKSNIIKFLLTYFKYNDTLTGMIRLKRLVDGLLKTKINWPELQIINNGSESEQLRLTKSF